MLEDLFDRGDVRVAKAVSPAREFLRRLVMGADQGAGRGQEMCRAMADLCAVRASFIAEMGWASEEAR